MYLIYITSHYIVECCITLYYILFYYYIILYYLCFSSCDLTSWMIDRWLLNTSLAILAVKGKNPF